MATGYTHDVTEKTTLREFALRCALAFFYDLDGPLPEAMRMPTYHANLVAGAEKELDALDALTAEEADRLASAAYVKALETRAKARIEKDTQLRTYRDLLEKVKAWRVAGTELEALRAFMIDQLRETIAHDFPDGHFEACYPAPRRKSAAEWIAEQREQVSRSLVYHREKAATAAADNAHTNAWLAVLRASLPPE
jgi:hypothetical protein